LPVFADTADHFVYDVVPAALTFERGEDNAVTALVLHQNGRDQRAEKVSSRRAPPSTAAISRAVNRLAVELYGQLTETPGNFSFSPCGLSTALALAYAGARGQTREEMARVLHLEIPPERVAGRYAGFLVRMVDPR
jgi:hypothetical protein